MAKNYYIDCAECGMLKKQEDAFMVLNYTYKSGFYYLCKSCLKLRKQEQGD